MVFKNTHHHCPAINPLQAMVVNIGNTNIRFGLFQGKNCLESWVINTKPYRTKYEIFSIIETFYRSHGISEKAIQQVIIGSVVPQMTAVVYQALSDFHPMEILMVDRNTPSLISHHSSQMGTDLYANATAAQMLYPQGAKIVVDFGTALTFTCLSESGEILGVVIAPGVITSLNALTQQTAQLPEIQLKETPRVLGKETVECMSSGMIHGYLGMVEGIIARINQEIGQQCHVVATGGMSGVYAPLTKSIHHQDILHTLKGLYLLGQGFDN